MATTAVLPVKNGAPPITNSLNPPAANKSLQAVNRFPPPTASLSLPQNDQGARPSLVPGGSQSFHRPYQFRPRFPPNKGQEDIAGLMYDGKRMRKAIHRKTVDYNPSVFKYLQNRVWQRDRRDEHQIQPDSLYAVDLVPPPALLEHPMNCVTTRFVRTSTNKFRCPIFCLTWTPEGRRLVTGASSGEFTLWNGLTFNFETILQAHETAVRAMRWSHSDAWMVTADHAGYIKYWQSNMNNVKMYQAHKEPIRGISFCPSDTKFASCSDDGTVRIWDFMRCHEERILRGHGADVRCVDWHPQKALIASGSKDNQQPVKLWDPRSGNSLATLHAHKHTVMDLKWHQNGNWMLTASRDHLLKLFDIRNLKEELQTFKGHKREATAIGWHPIHEGLFVSGSADGALMFWMVGCDHEVGGMEEAHEGMVWSVAWHPLGHILASGSNDHATKFWTRNRPGDEMRDKYNLNTLPMGMMEQELLEYNQESMMPNLPGMGLEHGLPEHLQIKEEEKPVESELPSIPGLDWEEDAALLRAEEKAALKKVPYARPVPKMFEQAWSGEIDVDQLKKEQQQQQLKAQFMAPSPSSLLLAQQVLGAAIAGTLRQQLANSEGGRMLLPGGSLMLGPGAPRMIIAPGQPVMGPRGGQMVLIPGGPGSGNRAMGPGNMQQNMALDNPTAAGQQIMANAMAILANTALRPQNNMGNNQQSGNNAQMGLNQNQGQGNVNQGQVRPTQGQMGPMQNQMRPQGTQGPQGQAPGQGQIRQQNPQGPPSNHPPQQMGPRPPVPAFPGQQGQFGPNPNQQPNRSGPQDMDRDERYQGPGGPAPNQMGGPSNLDMDQDYRPRVYNGPGGPLNTEDEDYRQAGQGVSRDPRQGSMGDPRVRGMDPRVKGNDNYQGGVDEYGDRDEREIDGGDYDHRNMGPRGRGGHMANDNGGWDEYEDAGYAEESWDGGDGGYEEDYEGYGEAYSVEQENRGDNRGRKRVWEEGPGVGPRGRGGPP
ncbi:unnamed protein product, partial [Lymnaea stagnalis]